MNTRIDTELAGLLERLARRHPAMQLPFIVTLVPGARAADVVPFKPTQVVEIIRMVAGPMTARQALDLARNDQVERIEHDGQAHAIEALLAGGN